MRRKGKNSKSKGRKNVFNTEGMNIVNSGKPHSIMNRNEVRFHNIQSKYTYDLWEKTGEIIQELMVIGPNEKVINLINLILKNTGSHVVLNEGSGHDRIYDTFISLNDYSVKLTDFVDKSDPNNREFVEMGKEFTPEIKFNNIEFDGEDQCILSITMTFKDGIGSFYVNLNNDDMDDEIIIPLTFDKEGKTMKRVYFTCFDNPSFYTYKELLCGIISNHRGTDWISDFYEGVDPTGHGVERVYKLSMIPLIDNGELGLEIFDSMVLNQIMGHNIYPLHYYTVKSIYSTSLIKGSINQIYDKIDKLEELIDNCEGKKRTKVLKEIKKLDSEIDFLENELERQNIILDINRCSLVDEFRFHLDPMVVSQLKDKDKYIIELEYDPTDKNYFMRLKMGIN